MMKSNIEYIHRLNRGWGFQEAGITYDKPLNLLILPCAWFDPGWIPNPSKIEFDDFFNKSHQKWNFDIFFPNTFCYHWHNRWKLPIENTSICRQLDNIICKNLK